jgi:hypothetical protein
MKMAATANQSRADGTDSAMKMPPSSGAGRSVAGAELAKPRNPQASGLPAISAAITAPADEPATQCIGIECLTKAS